MSRSSSQLPTTTLEKLQNRLEETCTNLKALQPQLPEVVKLGEAIITSLAQGGTLFTAGNGGSAAQALHLSEELIGRYEADRPPIRSVSLVTDPTSMTCIANDFGFEMIFERPLRGLARPGDVLLALSTSGHSENIVRALQAAKEIGVTTLGLLGRDGGSALASCEQSVVISSDNSATIQDVHQVVIHLLCEMIEAAVAGT